MSVPRRVCLCAVSSKHTQCLDVNSSLSFSRVVNWQQHTTIPSKPFFTSLKIQQIIGATLIWLKYVRPNSPLPSFNLFIHSSVIDQVSPTLIITSSKSDVKFIQVIREWCMSPSFVFLFTPTSCLFYKWILIRLRQNFSFAPRKNSITRLP